MSHQQCQKCLEGSLHFQNIIFGETEVSSGIIIVCLFGIVTTVNNILNNKIIAFCKAI